MALLTLFFPRSQPMIYAASQGHVKIVRYLVASGADVNLTTKKGWTAIMSAAFNGHSQIVKFLVQSEADLTISNVCIDCPHHTRPTRLLSRRTSNSGVARAFTKLHVTKRTFR